MYQIRDIRNYYSSTGVTWTVGDIANAAAGGYGWDILSTEVDGSAFGHGDRAAVTCSLYTMNTYVDPPQRNYYANITMSSESAYYNAYGQSTSTISGYLKLGTYSDVQQVAVPPEQQRHWYLTPYPGNAVSFEVPPCFIRISTILTSRSLMVYWNDPQSDYHAMQFDNFTATYNNTYRSETWLNVNYNRTQLTSISYVQNTITTGTTYLTRASTSGTNYLTRASTSETNYLTRASTSGTTYLTRASTSGTTYLTRASTSSTIYLTRASTSATTYLTRSSTSGYSGVSTSSSSTSAWQ